VGNPGVGTSADRFAKSCVRADVLEDFHAVPESRRRLREKPRHVSVPELDRLLDAYDPAADKLGPCVLRDLH
jgi:hypothetical protein